MILSTKRHRGANPQDSKCFDIKQLNKLKTALNELSWLLNHGYTISASSELVGNHHQLTSRQRMAIARIVCTDEQIIKRKATCLPTSKLKDKTVVIDGFNLLITIEAALGGGAIFNCSDSCYRDLSAVYGSYKIVAETTAAIEYIGKTLELGEPKKVVWLFDRPVSNSAKIAELVREIAAEHKWPFEAETTDSTDSLLSKSPHTIVTCDSAILERTKSWCNLAYTTITQQISDAWIIDLIDLK
ncbi:MAG: DUF434 domain-containing protein [Sulfurimonas sp.]|nr:DUF434 domain-containing protein [Sulfurimonas sp.]